MNSQQSIEPVNSASSSINREHPVQPVFARKVWSAISSWFVVDAASAPTDKPDHIDWMRVIPYIGMHLMCLAVIWVGVSPVALLVALLAYLVRMFAITGFYHRYFSHRTFKTSRVGQFIFALLGAAAVQRGPIWWAAHHRHHHAHSDQHDDVHSPSQHGFWRAHSGWFLTSKGFAPDLQRVRDLLRYPELRWLDRFDIAVPVLMAYGMLKLGQYLNVHAPQLHTNGFQMLVWGFFVSTIACYHITYFINSLAHVFGSRRYKTGDDSRNNWWLALLTLGEGWHNNHHHYPASTRQGFYWWEVDITFYLLKALSLVGIVWDLKPVPNEVRNAHAPQEVA